MLKQLRQHAKYFYVLFFLIIISFVFWGVNPSDDAVIMDVATVGGESIPDRDYRRTYDSMARLYRDIYKEGFDAEAMGLKKKVLDSMVNEMLLSIAADEAGIAVTDKELQEAIINDPGFSGPGGTFSKAQYLRALQSARFTTGSYEATRRRDLKVSKMRRMIRESVDLTEGELPATGGDADSARELRKTLLEAKKNAAVISFIVGLKKRISVSTDESRL